MPSLFCGIQDAVKCRKCSRAVRDNVEHGQKTVFFEKMELKKSQSTAKYSLPWLLFYHSRPSPYRRKGIFRRADAELTLARPVRGAPTPLFDSLSSLQGAIVSLLCQSHGPLNADKAFCNIPRRYRQKREKPGSYAGKYLPSRDNT